MAIINRDSYYVDKYTPGFCQYCGQLVIFGEKSDGGRPVLDPYDENDIGGDHRRTCPSPLNPYRIESDREENPQGYITHQHQDPSRLNATSYTKETHDKYYEINLDRTQVILENLTKKLKIPSKIVAVTLRIISRNIVKFSRSRYSSEAIVAAIILCIAFKHNYDIPIKSLANVLGQMIGTIKKAVHYFAGPKILGRVEQKEWLSDIAKNLARLSIITDEGGKKRSDNEELMRGFRGDLLSGN